MTKSMKVNGIFFKSISFFPSIKNHSATRKKTKDVGDVKFAVTSEFVRCLISCFPFHSFKVSITISVTGISRTEQAVFVSPTTVSLSLIFPCSSNFGIWVIARSTLLYFCEILSVSLCIKLLILNCLLTNSFFLLYLNFFQHFSFKNVFIVVVSLSS